MEYLLTTIVWMWMAWVVIVSFALVILMISGNPIKGRNGWLNKDEAMDYVNDRDVIRWGNDHPYPLFEMVLSDHGVKSKWGYYKQEELDRVLKERNDKFKKDLVECRRVMEGLIINPL